MKYYVMSPDLTPYEGVKITKETELTFENEKVKQSVKDLKLISEYKLVFPKYTTYNRLEMNLEEGEILLFEGENRGYFLPSDIIPCTIEGAIEQYEALALALDGDKENKEG